MLMEKDSFAFLWPPPGIAATLEIAPGIAEDITAVNHGKVVLIQIMLFNEEVSTRMGAFRQLEIQVER